jgi:hypothetical protein
MTPVQLHAKIGQIIRDFSPLAEKEGFNIKHHLKNSGYGQDWHAWQEWSVWEKGEYRGVVIFSYTPRWESSGADFEFVRGVSAADRLKALWEQYIKEKKAGTSFPSQLPLTPETQPTKRRDIKPGINFVKKEGGLTR